MPLITITSDLGLQDYAIPALKGHLLGHVANLSIVDISHQVTPFHYVEAAYLLGSCYREFPEDTIHIVTVEGDFAKQPEFVMAKVEGQIIVTKNTGFISLVSDQEPEWAVTLKAQTPAELKFPLVEIMGKLATGYLNGNAWQSLGTPSAELPKRLKMEPRIGPNLIAGTIIYITPHKNVVSNIHRRHVEEFSNFENCKISYGRNNYFEGINTSYYNVAEGEAVCFFSHTGLLEIGIHGGNGSELLSLYLDGKILLEFE